MHARALICDEWKNFTLADVVLNGPCRLTGSRFARTLQAGGSVYGRDSSNKIAESPAKSVYGLRASNRSILSVGYCYGTQTQVLAVVGAEVDAAQVGSRWH